MNWLSKSCTETFRILGYSFDIDKAKQLVASREPVQLNSEVTKQIRMPMISVNKDYAMTRDITNPVILGNIAYEKNKTGAVLIDGYHRVHKAISENKGVLAHFLSFEETLSIIIDDFMRQRMLNIYQTGKPFV